MLPIILDLASLRALYAAGTVTPLDVIEAVIERRAGWPDKAVFITPTSDEDLRIAARALMEKSPEPNSLPLWGIPFAVKDNIDVAGLATTAACPAFEYRPAADATVIARLRAAGAIVIGKTNLDQFATGLNGTRSPYGAPRSVFDAAYVSGGSSSGSSVTVAAGFATFALGTDTAGSGRVPAAFQNLVGIKPTPGLLSNTGTVSACKSVDCITIFAATVGDGVAVRNIAEGFDASDPFSRRPNWAELPRALRVGVLEGAEREFFGNAEVEKLYDAAIENARSLGATIVPFDYAPFREAAALLYDGPWVAERLAAVGDFIATNAADFDPTVRGIIEGAKGRTAVEAFNGKYKLEQLRRKTEATWAKADVLLLPTSPTTYTVEEMLADPVRKNSHFGRYTNFVNLLDCAAIAIPAGFDSNDHLPAGVTLIAPAFTDDALAPFADALHRLAARGMGRDKAAVLPEGSKVPAAPSTLIPVVVVGAHLTGMPLNKELTGPGGRLIKSCRTTGDYRLYALPGTVPPKPGMIREPGFASHGLAVEVWELPPAAFGQFVARIPAPLGVGKIALDDGSSISGFLCEPYALVGAEEVTHHGGWRAYIASRA
ncbi:allophanate hydrolase [Devosia sp. UYZn731]|uniref:allophanate hydrolase n=1 Tax=Devosia sp. UYZn731 TaxID=3156345 RepID=UPI0033940A9F